jgi:5-methylcytosine-specific restriction protein B
VLDLIIEAAKSENLKKPYFLILDEMNMSHVERYFADFLSSMESGEEVFLHPNSKAISGVPSALALSKNLFIVGTVNIDETTYMFSPKVLDRASVIEFRVSSQDMDQYLQGQNSSGIHMDIGLGKRYSDIFMELAAAGYQPQDFTRNSLMKFFEELEKIGAEFGYRTAYEINKFCGVVRGIDADIKEEKILDFAIMQKLLPKVHGSRRKLEPVLRKMIELCLEDKSLFDDLIQKKKEVESSDPAIRYPLSLRKILRMYWGMTDNGFTSYTEA